MEMNISVLQLYWKRDWRRCFPVNFAKFLRTPFFIEHPDGCFYYTYILVELDLNSSALQSTG